MCLTVYRELCRRRVDARDDFKIETEIAKVSEQKTFGC